MRLLVDARPFVDATGGVARVARELVSAFIEHATDVETILATTGVGAIHELPLRTKHIHLRVPNKLWSSACMMDATSLDREVEKRAGKIDAIFLPNLGFVGKLHRPYVLLLHDLSFLIEPRWFSPRMRLWHHAVRAKRLIQHATHLLAVSERTKRDAMRLLNIPEERITVIPIGSTLPEPPLTPPSQGGGSTQVPLLTKSLPRACRGEGRGEVPSGRFVLAFAGNKRKNAAAAIAAMTELRRDLQFNDLELLLVGAIHELPLPWVRNIHHPSDSELTSLYTNASALLYPSWYEGYGLPLHEAASFGTPCIASTAGALPETAPSGTLFADPAKPSHWVEALRLAFHLPHSTLHLPDPLAWLKAAKILENCLKSLKTD